MVLDATTNGLFNKRLNFIFKSIPVSSSLYVVSLVKKGTKLSQTAQGGKISHIISIIEATMAVFFQIRKGRKCTAYLKKN